MKILIALTFFVSTQALAGWHISRDPGLNKDEGSANAPRNLGKRHTDIRSSLTEQGSISEISLDRIKGVNRELSSDKIKSPNFLPQLNACNQNERGIHMDRELSGDKFERTLIGQSRPFGQIKNNNRDSLRVG